MKPNKLIFAYLCFSFFLIASCNKPPFEPFPRTETSGVQYSDDPNFKCGCDMIDERDQQVYRTVEIGSLCWMAENLNIGNMIMSDGADDNQADNDIIEKYCYENDSENCEIRGGLYQFNELVNYQDPVIDLQGICPKNWHIPTQDEWVNLLINQGISMADAMKDELLGQKPIISQLVTTDICAATPCLSPPCGESGFDLLFSGIRQTNGTFLNIGIYDIFWTSTLMNNNEMLPYTRRFLGNGTLVNVTAVKNWGLPCRCVQD